MSKKAWKHQVCAIEAYSSSPFFGLLFDMGCGKSLTAARIAENKNLPVLIIAPNALCKQWAEELTDKSPERITEKDWNVLVCTSQNKNTKKFKQALDEFCFE